MGLDMYAFKTKEAIPDVDVVSTESCEKLAYWRKHPNLHGWMESLYRAKGGSKRFFNRTGVQLTSEDLDALQKAVQANELPHTEGFFFGQSTYRDREVDEEFIRDARQAIADGYSVFYTSWW